MTALGWTLFFALYAIGLAYFHAKDRVAWRRQGILYPWGRLTRKQVAWPLAMLSDTLEWLRR